MSDSGVGLALFAAPALAVVGAGVLTAEGLMWCGRKLEANYQRARRSYIDLEHAAIAQARANRENRRAALLATIDRFSRATHLSVDATGQDITTLTDTAAAIAEARAMLQQVDHVSGIPAPPPEDDLSIQLLAEIEAATGVASSAVLQEAQQALTGSPGERQEAIEQLRTIVTEQTDAAQHRLYLQSKSRAAVRGAFARLQAVEALGQQDREAFSTHAETVDRLRQTADDALHALRTDPSEAIQLAESVQQAARTLETALADALLDQRDELRRRSAEQRGRLVSLRRIIEDSARVEQALSQEVAPHIAILSAEQTGHLAHELESIARQLEELEPGPRALQALKRASMRLDLLERTIFTAVHSGQRSAMGLTIEDTLRELGFDIESVETVGDSMRIVAKRETETPGFRQNQRLVYFDMESDGRIAYDFAGYAGDSCVEEAERIFARLRARGIVVVDPASPAGSSFDPSVVLDRQNMPQFDVTKRQAKLHEAVLDVLRRMGFDHIEQSAGQGYLDIDAFNGSQGHRYHVELAPDGEAQLLKDGVEIVSEFDDPVSAAMHAVEEEQSSVPAAVHQAEEEHVMDWLDQYGAAERSLEYE